MRTPTIDDMSKKSIRSREFILGKIAELQCKMGLNDSEVARYYGVSPSYLSNIRNSRSEPSLAFSLIVLDKAGFHNLAEAVEILLPEGLQKRVMAGRKARASVLKRKESEIFIEN